MKSAAPIALVVALILPWSAVAAGKTDQECAAEFGANKAKIEGAQSQASFMAACRSGQEPVAGATSVARPAVPPATAAQQPATPPSAAGQATKTQP